MYIEICSCINTYTHAWCVFCFSLYFHAFFFQNTCVFLNENPPQQNSHLKNARLVVSRKERYLNTARKQIGGACRQGKKCPGLFFWFDSRVPNEDPGSLGTGQKKNNRCFFLEISMVQFEVHEKKGTQSLVVCWEF